MNKKMISLNSDVLPEKDLQKVLRILWRHGLGGKTVYIPVQRRKRKIRKHEVEQLLSEMRQYLLEGKPIPLAELSLKYNVDTKYLKRKLAQLFQENFLVSSSKKTSLPGHDEKTAFKS